MVVRGQQRNRHFWFVMKSVHGILSVVSRQFFVASISELHPVRIQLFCRILIFL